MAKGRGRLSTIDLLPGDYDDIIVWAANELSDRQRTQVDIYEEFCERLCERANDLGTEIKIPSSSAFNRHSIKLAVSFKRIEETRQIASALNERLDAESSDELTIIAAEAIKTLIFEIVTRSGEAGVSTKGAQELANALRAAASAQSVSSKRRQTIENEFADKVDQVVEKVGGEAGLSKDQIVQIRRDVLGVKS